MAVRAALCESLQATVGRNWRSCSVRVCDVYGSAYRQERLAGGVGQGDEDEQARMGLRLRCSTAAAGSIHGRQLPSVPHDVSSEQVESAAPHTNHEPDDGDGE